MTLKIMSWCATNAPGPQQATWKIAPKKRKQPSVGDDDDALADAMLSLTKDQLKRIHAQLEQENRELQTQPQPDAATSSTLPPSLKDVSREQMVVAITQLRRMNKELV